jgi:hypothetical protein
MSGSIENTLILARGKGAVIVSAKSFKAEGTKFHEGKDPELDRVQTGAWAVYTLRFAPVGRCHFFP